MPATIIIAITATTSRRGRNYGQTENIVIFTSAGNLGACVGSSLA